MEGYDEILQHPPLPKHVKGLLKEKHDYNKDIFHTLFPCKTLPKPKGLVYNHTVFLSL